MILLTLMSYLLSEINHRLNSNENISLCFISNALIGKRKQILTLSIIVEEEHPPVNLCCEKTAVLKKSHHAYSDKTQSLSGFTGIRNYFTQSRA